VSSRDLIQQREDLTRAHDHDVLMRYAGPVGGIRAVVGMHAEERITAERAMEMIRESIAQHDREDAAAYKTFRARHTELCEQINAEHDALVAEIKAYEESAGGPR
jgi:hypothetical protein